MTATVAHGGTQCGVGYPPCGDYLGFVVDGSVPTLPLTLAPINGGAVQLAANFDKQSATTLAQQLNPRGTPLVSLIWRRP